MTIGHCKHGTFDLFEGCKMCMAELLGTSEPKETSVSQLIVKVRYYSETTGELSGREYTYYTKSPLSVGDVVTVPVRDTTTKAMVSTVDVTEDEVAAFKDKLKTIPAQLQPEQEDRKEAIK